MDRQWTATHLNSGTVSQIPDQWMWDSHPETTNATGQINDATDT